MRKTTYTARQGIFNRRKELCAYELLFRNGFENFFPSGVGNHEATSQIILNTHLNRGIDSITNGSPAFINFSEECLKKGLPYLLPKNKVVIEVLESVTPSDEMLQVLKKLHSDGYTVALDDFYYSKAWARFIPYVRLIKFDITKTPLHTIAALVTNIRDRRPDVKLLAERIETYEQFEEAKSLGFHLFQGYFFCKPEIKEQRDISPDTVHLIELLNQASKPDLDITCLCGLFSSDVGLTYKLLTYINSGALPLKTEITSIRQALIYLGASEVRKLILILTTGLIAKDKPSELTRVGVVRAKGAENIADTVDPTLSDRAFMVGLLSIIDAVLDMPMETVLQRLPVAKDVKEALVAQNSQSTLRLILNIVILAEQGSWHLTTVEASKIKINNKNAPYKQLTYRQVDDAMQKAQSWSALLAAV